MTTTGRATTSAPTPSDAAAALGAAPLARLLVRRDGDAVAAAGVLARALRAIDVPVQVAATATRAERTARAPAGDPDAATVAIGPAGGADLALGGDDRPLALAAVEVVRELDERADAPTADLAAGLALAGVHAAGAVPGEVAPELLETARERGLERRPGVALATDDLVDGLAHATLFHAPFSGDPDATADALADAGVETDALPATEEGRRDVASLVAVAATGGPAPERAATTIGRTVRPLAIDGCAPTVGGYADVLDAVTAVDPGLAVAHAVGDVDLDALLSAWRDASAATHAAIADAKPARYDGVVGYDAGSAPPDLLARVARDSCCPEPVALAAGADAVVVATREPGAPELAGAVADALGSEAYASARRAVVRDLADPELTAAIEAVRDATEADRP